MNRRLPDSFWKDKKITFFVAETVPSVAGSGISAFHSAQHIASLGGNVRLVCFNYNLKLPRSEKRGSIDIQRIPYFNINLVTKVLSSPLLLFHYFFASLKCNIVFVYGAYMPGLEIIFPFGKLLQYKIAFQSTLLGDDDITSLLLKWPRPLRKIRRWAYGKITLYYAINEEFFHRWISAYKKRPASLLSSQGVDLVEFQPATETQKNEARSSLKIPVHVPVILSAGILIERKGYRMLFETLGKIENPFIYLVAGTTHADVYHRISSKELAEIDSLIQLGNKLLGEKILFLGHCTDMRQAFAAADLFLHGGFREGTPSVVLEAMASGLPIVARKMVGLDFILQHEENALLFDTEKQLNLHVTTLLNNKELANKLSLKAYETVRNNHSFEQVFSTIALHLAQE